jgi:hypothetical protein
MIPKTKPAPTTIPRTSSAIPGVGLDGFLFKKRNNDEVLI